MPSTRPPPKTCTGTQKTSPDPVHIVEAQLTATCRHVAWEKGLSLAPLTSSAGCGADVKVLP